MEGTAPLAPAGAPTACPKRAIPLLRAAHPTPHESLIESFSRPRPPAGFQPNQIPIQGQRIA
jgi:hypothetical protein